MPGIDGAVLQLVRCISPCGFQSAKRMVQAKRFGNLGGSNVRQLLDCAVFSRLPLACRGSDAESCVKC